MKKGILITIIVGMFAWAIYDFVIKEEQSEAPEESDIEGLEVGLSAGDIAPDFKLETMEGESVNLSDFRGKRIMLNFWATWCPPCRAEMPDMQRFYEDEDVVILAVNLISTKNETVDKVADFMDEFGITFDVLLDEDSTIAGLYQIQPIPTNYLIDSRGVIHNVAYGALNYDLMVQEFEKMQ